tara:strand:+ start:192 stop:473 length:282 start_codon:yes stop_codon:yes gene_type:complete
MSSFQISKARLKQIIREEQERLDEESQGLEEKSTKKYDDNPKLKGDQDELPDGLQKAIIDKEGGDADEEEEKNESLELEAMIRQEILAALNGE